jgi:hypothetical protein
MNPFTPVAKSMPETNGALCLGWHLSEQISFIESGPLSLNSDMNQHMHRTNITIIPNYHNDTGTHLNIPTPWSKGTARVVR